MTVLITGASGFVGRVVVHRLQSAGHEVIAVARRDGPVLGDPEADWMSLMRHADAVVHLAGMVHIMGDTSHLAAQFEAVNVEGTRRLADQAADAGVRKFIFMSSVKVHGDGGHLTERSPIAPNDAYGRSKANAEHVLFARHERGRFDVTCIRPPLVYGPGVRANFAALAGLIRRGWPLPFGAIANARSLIGVENLADFVSRCLEHDAAGGEAFLVSDDEDLSTPELMRRMALAIGRRPRLWSVPTAVLRGTSELLGKRQILERLTGSLTVDIAKARTLLGWTPPFSVEDQLRKALTS